MVVTFVLSSGLVSAVGISGDNLNKYERLVPSSAYKFSYALVAAKEYDNSYAVYAQNDLAPYISFEQTHFDNIPAGSFIPITGQINFPDTIAPGWHYARICVIEDCPGGGTVCGRASSCAQLNFMALYPGILPQILLRATHANQDQPIDFTLSIENLGKDDIKQATGYVDVYDLKKDKVGTAFFDSKSIKSGEKDALSARFDTTGLLPGNYSATAFVDCDGSKSTANTTFRIGDLKVNVIDYAKNLSSGGIKRFVLTVESAWNDPLDVFAEVIITGTNASASAKTSTNRLQPWQKMELEAFIDTSTLGEGEGDVRIILYYADKTSVTNGKIMIVAPQPGEPAVVKEEPKKEGMSATAITIILVVVVVILTIVNIFLALYRKKKE